jgi:hypothetical protein
LWGKHWKIVRAPIRREKVRPTRPLYTTGGNERALTVIAGEGLRVGPVRGDAHRISGSRCIVHGDEDRVLSLARCQHKIRDRLDDPRHEDWSGRMLGRAAACDDGSARVDDGGGPKHDVRHHVPSRSRRQSPSS